MKKIILFLLTIVVINSCSSRKKANDSTFLKGFFTYYNTLFNSKDALETELRNRDKSHRDNFYAPYIQILTYENQAEGSELNNALTGDDFDPGFTGSNMRGTPGSPGNFQGDGGGRGNGGGATILEIAEAKALKAIAKYSVLKNGEEKNKKIFDAHILLAQARIYQEKPLEALDALNYLFTNMREDKRLPLARIYQGLAYTKIGDYARAEEIFANLKRSDINKDYQQLASIYYSEMLLNAGKKQDAIIELENAYVINKNRKLRSRISFLRGQILADLGRDGEARESFVTAYQNANDFEFEVKSQIEIAKTFNGTDDDFNGAKEYLEKISKKGTYASRKNEFYYALGLMANKAGKKEEARQFFAQSLAEKISDPQVRGLTYYEIGKDYFENSDYLSAGAFYDSALAVMTYEPAKILLQEQSSNIKNVSANYYLIKKNDSILNLTKMPQAERIAYFTTYIDALKTKEQQQEIAQRKADRSKGFDTGDYSANSAFAGTAGGFQNFDSSKGSFYFTNTGTVAKGESTFKQIWGNRSLNDDWRTSVRSNSIEDLRNEALGLSTAPNPRRFEPTFYIDQLPTSLAEITTLKKARDTASLGLGRMYESYFGDTELATKTLYDLVDQQPEEETKLQALYQIFSMNYEKNPAGAERAKQTILTEFPYTSYAEFVRNPKNKVFSQSSDEVEKMYADAFSLYKEEKFEESKTLIQNALAKYPKDALVPKFALLNAFNTGKTAGKEIMILQLEQIALNYANTTEGEKAAEMLKYLHSDLQFETTDSAGNVVQPTRPENSGQKIPDSIKVDTDDLPQNAPPRPGGRGTPQDVPPSGSGEKPKTK